MRLLIFHFYDEKLMHENMLKYNVIQYCICAEHVHNINSSTFRSHKENTSTASLFLQQYDDIETI